jgi:hypothetical protein
MFREPRNIGLEEDVVSVNQNGDTTLLTRSGNTPPKGKVILEAEKRK